MSGRRSVEVGGREITETSTKSFCSSLHRRRISAGDCDGARMCSVSLLRSSARAEKSTDSSQLMGPLRRAR